MYCISINCRAHNMIKVVSTLIICVYVCVAVCPGICALQYIQRYAIPLFCMCALVGVKNRKIFLNIKHIHTKYTHAHTYHPNDEYFPSVNYTPVWWTPGSRSRPPQRATGHPTPTEYRQLSFSTFFLHTENCYTMCLRARVEFPLAASSSSHAGMLGVCLILILPQKSSQSSYVWQNIQ